jgi:hypothetical protein
MSDLTFAEWYNDRRLADVLFVHRSTPDRIAAYAHRVILSGRSSYWYRYFSNPPSSSPSPSTSSSPPSLSNGVKAPTLVTSLDDDGDLRPMDTTNSNGETKSSDTITILIDEHIDAFRAVLNHIYTGRTPSIMDGPEWLPDFVKLSRLYEIPALMYLTRRFPAPKPTPIATIVPSSSSSESLASSSSSLSGSAASPAPTPTPPSSLSSTTPTPTTTATTTTTPTLRHSLPSFLSPDLNDGNHTIAPGVHVTVGGASSLSVSIAGSAIGSPLGHIDHSPDDSLPASPSHHHGGGGSLHASEPSSPRGSSIATMQSSIDPIASPQPQSHAESSTSTSMQCGIDGSPIATTRGLQGQGSIRPVVIVKVDPVILSARSNYFRIMFSGRWRETQKSSVHLHNVCSLLFTV